MKSFEKLMIFGEAVNAPRPFLSLVSLIAYKVAIERVITVAVTPSFLSILKYARFRCTLQKQTKHISRPFLPRRDVSCRLALSPGQYVIVPTTFKPGMPGRFWVHVKADRNVSKSSAV